MTNSELTELLEQARSTKALPSLAGETIVNCDLSNQFFSFPLDFTGARFAGPAVFKNVGFRAGATFVGTHFDDTADFEMCRFVDYGYFWNSTFLKTTSFLRAVFEPGSPDADHPRHPGEANFSYSQFRSDVSFQRARFGGISYFHRTTFQGHTDFAEARFEREVRFAGWANDICVPLHCIPTRCLIYMQQQGLICECPDNRGYINFDLRIKHAQWLKDALAHPGITRAPVRRFSFRKAREGAASGVPHNALDPKDVDAVVALYEERQTAPMFPPGREISFRGVTVVGGPKGDERAFLSSMDLALCRFQGCTIARFAFDEVTWGSRRTTLRLSSRYAIRDEHTNYSRPDFYDNGQLRSTGAAYENQRTSMPAEEYHAIERLYRELRHRAESDGELQRAQDFYYGELEMSYRSQRRPRRWFSLLFLYRYFSGFGKQHGLAASWLFLFIFVIFPSGYYSLGRHVEELGGVPRRIALYAEIRSLEASTLLSSSRAHDLGLKGDLLTGLERIVVPLQAGLLLLSLKYKFQHKPGD